MSARTIVIGDLHGCFDEAVELLDRVAACASDRVVFVGDLVDRGPKRRECVELAMRHESVLGNHEGQAQCILPPGRKSYWPSKAPADHRFWTHYWRGPERLIFGHSVLSEPLITEHAVGIDTGAVHGRSLTAVVLPDWEIVSVPARAAHHGSGKSVARIPLHGAVCAYS